MTDPTRWTGPALTPTELRILRLKCDGLRTKQIAGALECSERTVSSHLYNIHRKARCSGLALVMWAIKHGHISIDTTTEGQSSPRLGADVRPTEEAGDGQAHAAVSEGEE